MRKLEELSFRNTYARLPEAFYSRLAPTPFSKPPYLVSFNADAAALQDATLAVHITNPGARGGHTR